MDDCNIDPFLSLVKGDLDPATLNISWSRIWLNIPLAPPPLDPKRRFPHRERVIRPDGSDLGWAWSFLVAEKSLLWKDACVWIQYRVGDSVLHVGGELGLVLTVQKTSIPGIVRISFLFNQWRIENLRPERPRRIVGDPRSGGYYLI